MAQFRKGKLYHFAGTRWDKRSHATVPYEIVIIGELVRSYIDPTQRENDCKGEFRADGRTYRIDDGHLPDYQPRVNAAELSALMGPQAIRFAYPVA